MSPLGARPQWAKWPGRRPGLMDLRRLAQAAAFAAFVFLLLRTEYRGVADIAYPVNAFFQLDPLLGAAASMAGRVLTVLFWPALLTLAATLALGRVFCGWLCPMGSLLDFLGRWRRGAPHPVSTPRDAWGGVKYWLLAAVLAASLAGLQAAWLLDPFSLLSRAFSVAVMPAANLGLVSLFDFAWEHFGPATAVTEPVYGFLKEHVLTFEQQHFSWGLASLALLGGVLALEYVRPRFWCRSLCPLGALLSLAAAISPFRRRVSEACVDCGACYRRCPLGLIEGGKHREASAECTACLGCRELCPEQAISFGFAGPRKGAPDVSRRLFLGGAAAGLAAVPFFSINPFAGILPPALVRPPGALPERDFLRLCVRCGSCMKVCLGNAINPAMLEAGPQGLMTPVMAYRQGWCEYNCTLCGQVCPTGALRRLNREEKHRFKTGEAVVDQNRCIPYAGLGSCIVCEEHCPVPQKAIRFEEAVVTTPSGESLAVKRPRVIRELCIGCGICETKCPVEGRAAIAVTNSGESRRSGA